MVHENYKEMLAPYALSTLDREDARALEEHLPGCRDCRWEMDEWNATIAALALTAAPVEPSPRVRANILERIRAERATANTVRKPLREHPEQVPGVITFPPPKRVWNSTQKFALIAATLALIALLISVLVLWKQNRSAHDEIAKLSAEKASAQQELDRQRRVLDLLSTRGARLAVLSGTPQAPNAQATLTFDRQTGNAVLLASGLPPAPAGKAYQLWFIVGKSPMPGRVFVTDPTGKAILNDQVPSEALKTAIFAVTLEPEGGVKAPTGPIYLVSAS